MKALLALLFALVLAQDTGLKPPAQVKAAFLKMLDRPKVDPDPKVIDAKTEGGLVTEHLSIASEKRRSGEVERVPILLVRPEKVEGRVPAVIILHGTGGAKEGQRGWCQELAKKGMIGLAIDARYHGERSGGAKGAAAYVEAITRAWQSKPEEMEHPFYFDTVWDLWRTVDWLVSRSDVDPKRLGMIGFSMGGIETWLAASVDDRIAVAVPAIGVQSFRYSLENDLWQGRAKTIAGAHTQAAKDLGEPEVNQRVCRELWGKVIPGILGDFDGPSLIRLFAGRPLLILNGEKDPNCPIGGARLAFAQAEEAFKAAGCPEKLKILVHPGGHAVPPDQQQAARDWFEKWLR
ncbi:MAG TPA: alpha/beta fold hydrolase [Planctomycetota bacterium]|nr:alpha/beta fold hydrolase [Planctomycetota bacterium]